MLIQFFTNIITEQSNLSNHVKGNNKDLNYIKIKLIAQLKIQMTSRGSDKNEIEMKLVDSTDKPMPQNIEPKKQPIVWQQFEYKQLGNAPRINFSGLVMCILAPVLVVAHIFVADIADIPFIQFAFVTILVAFIINYTAIIRRYELMPYLPLKVYDDRLKRLCILALLGMVLSLKWGWNGSSGMIFACLWEYVWGSRMGLFWYIFLLIGVGSLVVQDYNTGWEKILEFVPGLIYGYIASTLFTMGESSTYAITHQFVFLASMALPMFFPVSYLVVPTLWQWLIMAVAGCSVLFTIVLLIKLMQSQRPSIAVASISGIVIVGTANYIGALDFIGATMIIVGTAWMIHKEYIEARF